MSYTYTVQWKPNFTNLQDGKTGVTLQCLTESYREFQEIKIPFSSALSLVATRIVIATLLENNEWKVRNNVPCPLNNRNTVWSLHPKKRQSNKKHKNKSKVSRDHDYFAIALLLKNLGVLSGLSHNPTFTRPRHGGEVPIHDVLHILKPGYVLSARQIFKGGDP